MRMKTWTKHNQKGFTAMELLITVLILLIVIAVSTPFMLGAIQNYRLRGAAWQLAGDLRLARQKSVSSGREYMLWFSHDGAASDKNSYGVYRKEGTTWPTTPPDTWMDPRHRIYLQQPGGPAYVMIDSTSTPPDGKIYFLPTGTISTTLTAGTAPWTIKLVDSRGKRYNLSFNLVGWVNVTKI